MKERAGLLAAAAAVILGGTVLFSFDPATTAFYPPCLFRLVTGFQCPGCGSLRAMHQLLHGHVAAAFALNPLAVIVLPVVAAIAVVNRLRSLRRRTSYPF